MKPFFSLQREMSFHALKFFFHDVPGIAEFDLFVISQRRFDKIPGEAPSLHKRPGGIVAEFSLAEGLSLQVLREDLVIDQSGIFQIQKRRGDHIFRKALPGKPLP